MKKYHLVHNQGCIFPFIVGRYNTYKEMSKGVVELMNSDRYDPEDDGVFYIEVGKTEIATIPFTVRELESLGIYLP